jgi:hypothetical protein
VKSGPLTGQTFSYVSGLVRSIFLDFPPGEQIYWLPNPVEKCQIGNDTQGLLDYCESLIGYHYAIKELPRFPDWLIGNGFDAIPLDAWSDMASALRLVATLRQWRIVDGLEMQGQTDVCNVRLLCTKSEIISWMKHAIETRNDAIQANLSDLFNTADPRSIDLHVSLSMRIADDVKDVLNIPDAQNGKSLPVVDRLSRKLEGYMRTHGMQVPPNLRE